MGYSWVRVKMFWMNMSRKRFYFLLHTILSDDKKTRNKRKTMDKLAPIRKLFEIFVQHCQIHYCVEKQIKILTLIFLAHPKL